MIVNGNFNSAIFISYADFRMSALGELERRVLSQEHKVLRAKITQGHRSDWEGSKGSLLPLFADAGWILRDPD